MEIKTFRGGQDFFGHLNGQKRQQGAILGPKKVDAPSKSRDFHGKPLEMAQVCDLPPQKKYQPKFVTAELHW